MRIENSFIPVYGVGEHTERTLWQAGITEWGTFTGEVVGPTIADRIEAFIDTAADRLVAGDAAYFGDVFPDRCHWRLYESFRDRTCFLDIETTGLDRHRHEVTVVTLYQAGETTTLVRGRDLSAHRLREHLDDAAILVTFNGKQFDVPFLETAFDLSIGCPHIDLRYPSRRVGLTGGLKSIESTLGIGREAADVDGREAIRLWRASQRGDESALETLVQYNRDDTINMEAVLEAVTERLHEEVFASVCSGDPGRQTELPTAPHDH